MPGIIDSTSLVSDVSYGLATAAVSGLLLLAARRLIRRSRDTAGEGQGFHDHEADLDFEGLFYIERDVITDVNVALCSMIGRARREIVGSKLATYFTPECYNDLQRVVTDRRGQIDAELMTADRGQIEVEVRAPSSDDGRSVLAVRDITDRKKAERRNRVAVFSDPLTGVGNSALFHERLRQSIEWSQRTHTSIAVFSIGIDRMRSVTERLGHSVANGLLMEVAERLCDGTRQIDTVARMSDDKFAIIATLLHRPEDAQILAQRLLTSLNAPYHIEGAAPDVAVCIGIVLYPDDTARTESVLQFADMALARASATGDSRLCFFTPETDTRLQARQSLAVDLHQALALGQLQPRHQGMFESATRQRCGHAVSLQWRHPVRGVIPTADFMSLIEDSGLVHGIGDWMIETACAAAAALPDEPTTVVPLSAAQFKRPDLAERIGDIVTRTGLDPERLECVVTESVLMEDTERVTTALGALKTRGVRIALDDVGMGLTSLSYLRRLPFDTLRIDGALIAELGLNHDADATVRALLAVARSLEMDVVAKGVETQSQLALLVAMGCPYVQGSLLDPSAPDAAVTVSDRGQSRAA